MAILEEVKKKERFENDNLTKEDLEKTLKTLYLKTKNMMRICGNGAYFIKANAVNKKYDRIDNLNWVREKYADNWTGGFWSGILWYGYLYSKDEEVLKMAKENSRSMEARLYNYENGLRHLCDLDHHDIGFLYLPSTKADYDITGSKTALDTTLRSADLLMKRYIPKAGILQAWGDMNDPKQRGRLIIDCNLNVPLLYFASKITKDPKYKEAADKHLSVAVKYLIREDASTYHTYFMDVFTGKPKYGNTFQGYGDESCWARGQAWGIYGFMLGYRYTKDKKYLDASIKLAHYFLNRLPKDLVCNWDLIFLKDNDQRDTSAAAIALLGIYKIYLATKDEFYLKVVRKITKSLIDNYISEGDGFLDAGVYHFGEKLGINESNIFGDFFFYELVMKLSRGERTFW